ncbi:TetR/AcrR family transcriptional regulator [Oceanicaulis alexandrii]|uniref:TetR/AcrR family transcriptional regulator n=1 Tax=Oceanicaulis alexandrii TaxID=153233 RepID=UPI0023520F43|nr:TetR/AcrR family transcriptional regulator [Oceanicaulis alexandrii]
MAKARKYHHGGVRETATRAALEMIEQDGVDALTMRALAKAVGVDHRALYRHYPDRDAVLAAVAAEGYRQLLSDQQLACEGASSPLQTAFEVYVGFALDHPHLHALMLTRSRRAMDAHAALGAAVKAELDQLMIWSRQALGVERGERETDARDLAFAALGAAYGLVTLASTASLMSRSPEDLRAFVTDQVNGVLTGQLLRFGRS